MIKRLFDLFFSILGFVFLIPVFIIVAIAIKLNSKGSVFFRQIRVGKDRKEFKIIKFRTMIENAGELGNELTTKCDPRITKVGEYLREYKLDELPQLINVIKGEMSLVGPRPEVPKYVIMYPSEYNDILKVKPGITDIASIKFRKESEFLKNAKQSEQFYISTILPEKICLAKKYINHASFLLDLKIICFTLFHIWFGSNDVLDVE